MRGKERGRSEGAREGGREGEGEGGREGGKEVHDREDVHGHFTHICTSGTKYISYHCDKTE